MFEKRDEAPESVDGGLQPPPSRPSEPLSSYVSPSSPPEASPSSSESPEESEQPRTTPFPWATAVPEPSPPGFDAKVLTGEPSRESLAMLMSFDPFSLNCWDAAAAAIGCEFAERLIQALQLQLLAVSQGKRREQGGLSEPASELSAATGVHSVTAATRADLGCSAVTRLPRTLDLLKTGKLTRKHLELVEQATRELSDDQAAMVDRKIRGPRGLRRRLEEAIERVAPGTAEKKHDRAVADRDVQFWTDQAEGKAGIELVGPVDRIAQIKAALDSCARNKLPEDLRSLGQRRFDVLFDWARTTLGLPLRPQNGDDVEGGDADRPVGRPAGCCDRCGRAGSNPIAVNVTVSLGALLKLSDALGDLDGQPIPAAVARELAADGRWRRLVLEDHTGRLLDVGAHTYQPGAELSRWLVARDRTCRFPSCTRPAADCQLDHIREFHSRHNGTYVHGPGDGQTVEANLAAACQPHHRYKTETPWTYLRDPVTGTITWTAPSGRTYSVEQDHYTDDPQLSAYLTRQTRRRQERQAARAQARRHPQATPGDPWTTPPDPDDNPPS